MEGGAGRYNLARQGGDTAPVPVHVHRVAKA